MKTLYLAEKPSQAIDIGKVLGVSARKDGYLVLASGDVISWAVGHLLELAAPEKYTTSWGGRWEWGQLPMIPERWKLEVNARTKKQFTVIKALLADVKRVVIATDAGREGELIAREILEHCKFKGKIERLWTSSLVASDIERALKNLKQDHETRPLYEAARARSHSDWLLGLSGTRAATLAAGVRGDFFAMGRVKTPTLAMVVSRCEEVDGFVAKEYFELEATVKTSAGHSFKMVHAPPEDARITDKRKAQELCDLANGHTGPLQVERTMERESPPLPYSLPALQKDANKQLGFSARETLKLAQALYEKKAATYPRTDCPYLAESQIAEVNAVLAAIDASYPSDVQQVVKTGTVARKSVFNDSKLSDHHGIIPTIAHPSELSAQERDLYRLICRRYLQVVSPDHEYEQTRLQLNASGVIFKAAGRVTRKPGWTAISK